MSEQPRLPPDAADAADAADQRMAELLSSTASSAEMRRQVQHETTAEAEDLLGRLNALDFVNAVVGEAADIPDRLGDYRITGLLGRGGMGTVYLAWQDQLEREVALKVLASSLSADPTSRQRFRAEARATAALHHRHIVPIYDYGEAQGCLFFAMERVDGFSLDKHVAAARRVGKRPLEPRDAARRFAGVADALGLAHRRRILHRDVKPGNILVAADGTLALTDFGLAKALDHASMHLTSKSGGFLGTLHYSPPEQALGGELSPASDLYSLGVTMFEAVSGELPIAGKTTEAVLQSILHGTPRRLRDVLPKPPRDLETVLDKLLCREPRDRYQDGEELARDLLRIADGEPVHIRRQSMFVRLWRRARKNPVLAGAVIAAIVLLLTTFFLLRVLRQEKGQSLESRHKNNLVAVVNQVKAEPGGAWGPAPLLDCLTGLPAPGVVVPSGAVLAALDHAQKEMPDDEQVARMRTAYVDDPLPDASELLRQGRGHEALKRFDQAIADALTNRSLDDLHVDLRLYRLYLGRAVANLTAAVARLGDARMDLALARFLRPGALFPPALAVLLDVADSTDVPATLQQLEQDLERSSPERRAVVGRLLQAMATPRPGEAANLMAFTLAHADRREVLALAERFLGDAPAAAPAAARAGLAAQLRRLAQDALQHVGEPAVLRDASARMADSVKLGVHPQSLLQSWCAVMQLLEKPLSPAPLLDGRGQALAPLLQLAAWDALLQLLPPRSLVELLLPRFEALRSGHPGLPGMTRVAALLHAAARSATARKFAMDWVVDSPGDPEALFCRMTVHLRDGQLPAACDDAMAAVQRAADRAAALHRVCDTIDSAAAEAPAGTREQLLVLERSFRAVPP